MTTPHIPTIVPIADRDQWLEMRRSTIGASESAALFESVTNESPLDDEADEEFDFTENGEPVSPYLSPMGLWGLKTGRITAASSGNNRITWGIRMEPIIANGIAEKEGWSLHKPKGYYLHPRIGRMGASLDYEVSTDASGELYPFEIKNVADTERWKWRNAASEWTVPGHILIQVQHQMSVVGAPKAYIGVLFGGSEERVFEVPRDDMMIAELEAAVEDFLWYVDNDVQPQPSLERDAWVIKRLYAHADPLKVLDWSNDDEAKALVSAMKEHASLSNAHKKEAEKLRTQITLRLGDAACATLGDAVLTAKTVEGAQIAYYREPYRSIRVQKPKAKHSGRPLAQILADGEAEE